MVHWCRHIHVLAVCIMHMIRFYRCIKSGSIFMAQLHLCIGAQLLDQASKRQACDYEPWQSGTAHPIGNGSGFALTSWPSCASRIAEIRVKAVQKITDQYRFCFYQNIKFVMSFCDFSTTIFFIISYFLYKKRGADRARLQISCKMRPRILFLISGQTTKSSSASKQRYHLI